MATGSANINSLLKDCIQGYILSEWNSAISVIGTLSGTAIGLLVGYWTSSRVEARREKHEGKMYYRNKLNEHMDDIIKPLYNLIQELWGSLAVLRESMRIKSSIIKGSSMEDLLEQTFDAYKKLNEFCHIKGVQIDLLLPHPLSTWVFMAIGEKIEEIVTGISEGKEPNNEFTQAINALMKYQKNLKKLIGYETAIELEDVYPFTSKK